MLAHLTRPYCDTARASCQMCQWNIKDEDH